MKTLDEQIACVRREIALRKSFYPKRVAMNRLTPAQAEHETQCMEAVLATLELQQPKQSDLFGTPQTPTHNPPR